MVQTHLSECCNNEVLMKRATSDQRILQFCKELQVIFASIQKCCNESQVTGEFATSNV